MLYIIYIIEHGGPCLPYIYYRTKYRVLYKYNQDLKIFFPCLFLRKGRNPKFVHHFHICKFSLTPKQNVFKLHSDCVPDLARGRTQ